MEAEDTRCEDVPSKCGVNRFDHLLREIHPGGWSRLRCHKLMYLHEQLSVAKPTKAPANVTAIDEKMDFQDEFAVIKHLDQTVEARAELQDSRNLGFSTAESCGAPDVDYYSTKSMYL
ncbi:hypothetical protein E5288_WYG018488 [Bos mutus]|uniref:Uncharacterized protein n=1 Tax=Bos mutus TaxID=72004 RepID=A0A6B0S1Q0_9CETA|nr:hypothetical protein [Bos mutus]